MPDNSRYKTNEPADFVAAPAWMLSASHKEAAEGLGGVELRGFIPDGDGLPPDYTAGGVTPSRLPSWLRRSF